MLTLKYLKLISCVRNRKAGGQTDYTLLQQFLPNPYSTWDYVLTYWQVWFTLITQKKSSWPLQQPKNTFHHLRYSLSLQTSVKKKKKVFNHMKGFSFLLKSMWCSEDKACRDSGAAAQGLPPGCSPTRAGWEVRQGTEGGKPTKTTLCHSGPDKKC